MSTIEERINGWLAALESEVTTAQKSAEMAGGALKLAHVLSNTVKVCENMTEEEKLSIVALIPSEALESAIGTIGSLSSLSALLGSLTGSSREAGDTLARSLGMAVESGLLEGEDRERAEKLVSAWQATSPKKSGGVRGGNKVGASSTPTLPFPVKVTCEAHGWSATQQTNLNSVRWAATLHHEKAHGAKFSRGDATFTGITEALTAVIEEKSASAQGGGYIVDKVSA